MKYQWFLILLPLAFLFTSCQPQPLVQKPVKTMYISATGTVELSPNLASFNITVTAIDKDISESRAQLAEGTQNLRKILSAHGIEAKDIVSDQISLQKHTEYQYNKYVFIGYKAQISNHVNVRDLDQLEALYSACLVQEDFTVSRLNYGHSAIDSFQRQAYSNALAKAHTVADALLQDLPETKRTVVQISNQKLPGSTRRNYLNKSDANNNVLTEFASNAPTLHFGELQCSETVYIEYDIE